MTQALLESWTRPLRGYLDDPSVTDIMALADGTVWLRRAGERCPLATGTRLTPQEAEWLLRYVASQSETTLSEERPSLEGTLPHWGARVQGWAPPIAAGYAFTLRKHAPTVYSLDDYVERGIVSEAQRDALVAAVVGRQNILIGGGMGTGKTTFANALLKVVAERTSDAVYIIEDDRELQCLVPCTMRVLTTRSYSMHDAVYDALRSSADRIIMGELRDGAALELLKLWFTGHPGGIATLHANSASAVLTRLCQLIEEVVYPAPRELVAEAVNLCVHLEHAPSTPTGRRVSGIVRVRGYSGGAWVTEPIA